MLWGKESWRRMQNLGNEGGRTGTLRFQTNNRGGLTLWITKVVLGCAINTSTSPFSTYQRIARWLEICSIVNICHPLVETESNTKFEQRLEENVSQAGSWERVLQTLQTQSLILGKTAAGDPPGAGEKWGWRRVRSRETFCVFPQTPFAPKRRRNLPKSLQLQDSLFWLTFSKDLLG